ncbi:hypothetical protein [Actinoplanes sp. NPDC026670]|uniref:hypothetical protein n=1 Tax=Actinoplanes sp. NPDC026670 TaxID=3154700 RepID=UPI0033F2B8C6
MSFLGRITPFLWILAIICTIGVISEVVGVVQQIPVQRGIDAHTVRLDGTFVELRIEGTFEDDKHFISYAYNDRGYRTALRGLPGNPAVGTKVCVEIDSTKPENIRPCDTRGGLGDSLAGLGWGGGILSITLLLLWAHNGFTFDFPVGFDWRPGSRRPERPHPSSLRRKPTRRDRKRARKAEREAEDELFRW